MKKRVIIIGGGAAGSMAALTAAQNGADVLLLEQNEIIGRKILSTGNGRCNFTNRFQDSSCYRSDNSGFAWKSIGKFSEPETTSFFKNLGIYPKDKNGYLYPWSEQASEGSAGVCAETGKDPDSYRSSRIWDHTKEKWFSDQFFKRWEKRNDFR